LEKKCQAPPEVGEEQCPVDISKTGITLINNMVGLLPVGIAAYAKGEIDKLPLLRPLEGGRGWGTRRLVWNLSF